MHFDILYIGQDIHIWNHLQDLADNHDLIILNIKSTRDIVNIKDDFSFTIVLTELHIDYNYEGFTIDKLGLKYSFFGILSDDLSENSITVSDYLFTNEEKFIVLKHIRIIDNFLISKPIQLGMNSTKLPIEA